MLLGLSREDNDGNAKNNGFWNLSDEHTMYGNASFLREFRLMPLEPELQKAIEAKWSFRVLDMSRRLVAFQGQVKGDTISFTRAVTALPGGNRGGNDLFGATAPDKFVVATLGVVMGTGMGGLGTLERECRNWLEKGDRGVSPHTVRSHVKNLLAKLGVSSRREALERLAASRA